MAGQAPSVGQRDHLDPVAVVAEPWMLPASQASTLAALVALRLECSPAGLSRCPLPVSCPFWTPRPVQSQEGELRGGWPKDERGTA